MPAVGAERQLANDRREQVVSVGSLDGEREQIAKLQGVFDSIAEALGVNQPDAIIEKFNGQEETYALLSSLHRTSRARIEQMTTERDEKRKALDTLRFASRSRMRHHPLCRRSQGEAAQPQRQTWRRWRRRGREGSALCG